MFFFFQDFNFLYSRSLKCSLQIAFYVLRIGVSVLELYGAEFLIRHTFQRKHYSTFLLCVMEIMLRMHCVPFLRKRSILFGFVSAKRDLHTL